MRTRGVCFETEILRAPLGSAAPPQVIRDMSRNHRHAVFTDAPTWVQLPSGLWCTQYVSAQTNYCTIPDITELLGATAATWMAWVRKDAYVQNQCVMSDYVAVDGKRHYVFGSETAENRWRVFVGGTGATFQSINVDGAFTTGWHFVWSRYTGNSATGLEAGCDNTVGTPTTTTSVTTLANTSNGVTFIGQAGSVYSSMTLGTLGIAARALTDEEINTWREKYRCLIGV